MLVIYLVLAQKEKTSDMKQHCFALDLIDDPKLIAEYETYHKNVWPEILESIKDSGIQSMEIYRAGNRLFMIMKVNQDFSFELKADVDLKNGIVQEWEKLMWTYQQALPFAKPGEKWVLMNKIFELASPLIVKH
jgi:L-rhamnose mutarotase